MGKGFGIAAIILIILSFPVPVVGTWIGYFALIIAAIAALFDGGKTYAIATTVIAAIKMYFLSPGLMATMYVTPQNFPVSPFFLLTTFFVALPILALIFRPALSGLLQSISGGKPPAAQ
ncbi:MAG: hypothetical protein R3C60_11780 [Parvularculaceae bacterium]